MSFWDKVKRLMGGSGGALEVSVRQAMLARVARRETFSPLDVANEVTAADQHRTADDLRQAGEIANRLFDDKLLEPFGYARDRGGSFVPPAQGNAPAPPPQQSSSGAGVVAQVNLQQLQGVFSQVFSPEQKVRAAINARAVKRENINYLDVVFDVTKVGAPDFQEVSKLAQDLVKQILPSYGYTDDGNMWRPPGFVAPAQQQQQQQQKPPAQQQQTYTPPPPQKPKVVNAFETNPEIMGLSADDVRKRSLKIDPYRTAWIGRVDTIPPQSDERTALIDRGLMLRGLLTEQQLADIHRVGDQWIKFHEADRLAQAIAARTADEFLQKQREEKAKKREERKRLSAEKEQARVAAVAKRRAEDIIFLGRGVSYGLADRRSNLEQLERLGLPIMSTPADVAKALGLEVKQLRWLCFHAEAPQKTHYVYFEVPKRSGGKRLLAAPHAKLKAAQSWVLRSILDKLPAEPEAHGFVAGRNVVSNARPHLKQGVVVNLDLKDFFPTISFRRVRGLFASFGYSPAVATVLALLCTEAPRRRVRYSGVEHFVAIGERCLPQGAPTSPAISNLVTRKLDRRLRGRFAKKGWTYTRYADDLSFSKKDFTRADLGFLHASIRHVVEDEGFALNPMKGRAQGRGGRQEVTGVVVNEKPSIARDEVRRLRAVLHQAKKTGLEAQNRAKIPNFRRHLEGKIAYVSMVDPVKGAKLKAALDAVP